MTLTFGCSVGRDPAMIKTLLLGVEKRRAGRFVKFEQRDTCREKEME